MGDVGDTSLLDDAEEGLWKFNGFEGWNPAKILEGIGSQWNFTRIRYKPYPCCSMFQAELIMFLHILEQNKIAPEEVESVKIMGHPTLDTPGFSNRKMNSCVDVQFSPAYVFSLAANGVPAGPDWHNMEITRSEKIRKFADKVTYRGYPDYGKHPTNTVEVVAKGKSYKEETSNTAGFVLANTTFTDEDVINKFHHNAASVLTEKKIEQAQKAILDLENIENVAEVMKLVTL
jgi:2-methylcitrate dehydratase PrpD